MRAELGTERAGMPIHHCVTVSCPAWERTDESNDDTGSRSTIYRRQREQLPVPLGLNIIAGKTKAKEVRLENEQTTEGRRNLGAAIPPRAPPSENPGSDDSQGALYMRPHMGPCSGLATLQTWRAGCWATPRPASEHLSTSA